MVSSASNTIAGCSPRWSARRLAAFSRLHCADSIRFISVMYGEEVLFAYPVPGSP